MKLNRLFLSILLSLAVLLAIGCDDSAGKSLFAKVSNPTADVAAGSYLFSQTVALSCETDGAVIHYTTDGSVPGKNSPVYSEAITVDQASVTIKALAVADGCQSSDVVEFTYEIGYKDGIKGPAGGYVFYDCDADNDSGNADGLVSTECGWRYLEAAPRDIGSLSGNGYVFGYYRIDSDGENLYVNDTASYVVGTSGADDGNCTGTAIGTGIANTTKLVAKMESKAYSGESGTYRTSYAAGLCDTYSYSGYSDWFLPSKDELKLMYVNLKANGIGGFASTHYWSSSESSINTSVACSQNFNDGVQYDDFARSDSSFRVRAVRAFLDADDNSPRTPISSLSSGTYRSAQTVTLSCASSDATILYTLDGTDPIFNGVEYTDGIEISYDLDDQNTVLKAVARNGKGDYSSVVEYKYVILGPAGGYVFYDCDADNDSGNADGLISTECGWRYLEAAPTDLVDDSGEYFVYCYYGKNPEGAYLFVNDSASYVAGTFDAGDGKCTGTAVGTGEANTTKLVSKIGSVAYMDNDCTDTTERYPARACAEYTCNGYDDWFLPSKDELNLMYINLHKKRLGGFSYDNGYWSSSEYETTAKLAWFQYFGYVGQYGIARECGGRVRAIRAF